MTYAADAYPFWVLSKICPETVLGFCWTGSDSRITRLGTTSRSGVESTTSDPTRAAATGPGNAISLPVARYQCSILDELFADRATSLFIAVGHYSCHIRSHSSNRSAGRRIGKIFCWSNFVRSSSIGGRMERPVAAAVVRLPPQQIQKLLRIPAKKPRRAPYCGAPTPTPEPSRSK